MATREQLIEDFADHKYATGEKFERLINSMKVVQEPVADPAASGTSHSFIASIEQDKDGKITATKKNVQVVYAQIQDKPTINGVTLMGDNTPAQLGLATANQVGILSDKVDKLPTGYYYGKFASVEDLPEATEKGYAYVASSDPTVFYTYMVSGAGAKWVDSGNKMVNTIDITTPKTSETELSKGEKYYASANVNDRPAVVVIETGVVKALGYKVLNPNLSFSSQVTAANTIYEVKDEFDLGGRSVTISANCTLLFNGGMLSNGTIIGNNTKIKDTGEKIFSGIYLGRESTWSIDYFRPEWWGGKADGETENRDAFSFSFYYGTLFNIPVKLSAGTYKCVPLRRERKFGSNFSSYIYTCVIIGTARNLKIIGDKSTILIDTTDIVDEANYDQSFFLFIDRYYRVTLQNITFKGKTKINRGTDAITVGTTPLATAASIMKNYASIVGCDPIGGGAGLTLDNVDVTGAYNVIDFEYYVKMWREHAPMYNTNINGDTNILTNARVSLVASVFKIFKLSQAVSNQIADCAFGNIFDGIINADCFMSWKISRCSITSPSPFIVQNGNTTENYYTNKVTFDTCKFEFAHEMPNWGNLSEAGIIKQKKGCPGVDILLINTSIGGGGGYVVNYVAMTLAGNSHITFVGGFFNAGIRIWPGATDMQVPNNIDGGYPNITFINVANPSPLSKIQHLETPVADTYQVIYIGRENKSYVLGNYTSGYREVLTPMSQLDIDASKVIEDGTVVFDGSKPSTGYTGMRGYDKASHRWLTLETVSFGNFGKWYDEQGQEVIDNTGTLAERCALTPSIGDTFLQEEADESVIRRFVSIQNIVGKSINGGNGYVLINGNCSVIIFDVEELVGSDVVFPQMLNPSSGPSGWAAYTNENQKISSGTYPSGTPGYGIGTEKTLTIPTNAKWLKVTFGKANIDQFLLKASKVYLIYDNDSFWKEGCVSKATTNAVVTEETLFFHYDLKDTLDNIGIYGTSSYIGFQAFISDTDDSINGLVIKWNGTKWIKSDGEELKVATPVITFNDSGSTHTATITCATTSATIYYTLDGTDPTSSSIPYNTEEISLTDGDKLKCIAIRNHMVNSDIVQKKLASPIISIVDGELKIESRVSGASIYYTLDGTNPNINSDMYSSSISIQSGTIVKAIAIMAGRFDSDIVTETYFVSTNK